MNEYEFTCDWVTLHESRWRELFAEISGRAGIRLLEIGSYEGRSAIWWLGHVLTDPTASLTCVDPFWDPTRAARFRANLALSGRAQQVRVIKGHSQFVLPRLSELGEKFDAIYIDGSHVAADVLLDGLFARKLLAPGGLLLFDDYELPSPVPSRLPPKLGIDALISVCGLEVIHRGTQVACRDLSTDQPIGSTAKTP